MLFDCSLAGVHKIKSHTLQFHGLFRGFTYCFLLASSGRLTRAPHLEDKIAQGNLGFCTFPFRQCTATCPRLNTSPA